MEQKTIKKKVRQSKKGTTKEPKLKKQPIKKRVKEAELTKELHLFASDLIYRHIVNPSYPVEIKVFKRLYAKYPNIDIFKCFDRNYSSLLYLTTEKGDLEMQRYKRLAEYENKQKEQYVIAEEKIAKDIKIDKKPKRGRNMTVKEFLKWKIK